MYEYYYELDFTYSNELIEYFNSIQDEELDFISIEATQIA